MALLVGVDGGATKTVAVVGRPDGTLIGFGRASSSNYHNIGIDKAARSIRRAIALACRQAKVSTSDLDTVVMGLAGMDSLRDFRTGRRVANLVALGKRRIVKHDSTIALYAATLGKPGIVVNAGTGSFAAGIGLYGEVIRAGGWGNIIDDEGSAYDIGKLGIRAALRALDGQERKTKIAKLLITNFKLRTLEDIVHEVHEKPMTVREISAISKLITHAALRGDQVARAILAHEVQALARLASTVARRLDLTRRKPDVYCTGGVFKAGRIIVKPFRRELRRNIPHFTVRHRRYEPAVGAFILALKERHTDPVGPVLANLEASYAQRKANLL